MAAILNTTPPYHSQHCNHYTAESPTAACQVSFRHLLYLICLNVSPYGYHLYVFIQVSHLS